MSNEIKDVKQEQVENVVEEKTRIEISVTDYERKIDIERAYLVHDGMNPEKARKKAAEIVARDYVRINQPVDYSNWAGQNN